MSIHDEQDLRSRLGTALDEFTPGPFPLDAVVSLGRATLVRRRISVAAAVAAVAVAAASVVALRVASGPAQAPSTSATRLDWPPHQVTPPRYHVTAYQPGPGFSRGLIAYGHVDATAWRVTGTRGISSGKPNVCVTVVLSSAAAPTENCQMYQPALASRHGSPADLGAAGSPGPQIVTGTVRADVAYLRVSLSNGQVLTLRPVAIFGPKYAPYVAFGAPSPMAVTLIRAYSRRGELAYAVPFTADNSVETVRWIGVGRPALPSPAAYMVGSGEFGGARWTSDLYVGPWGSCFTFNNGNTCLAADLASLVTRGRVARVVFGFGSPPFNWVVMAAAPSVRYLMIRGADGSTGKVPVAEVSGVGLAVFNSPPKDKAVSWVAYSATGTRLGSGRVN